MTELRHIHKSIRKLMVIVANLGDKVLVSGLHGVTGVINDVPCEGILYIRSGPDRTVESQGEAG